MTRWSRLEDGSAPIVELALGAPVIALVIWLVIWGATAGQTSGEARLAANDAARLASTIRTATARPAAAAGLVDNRLAGSACAAWTTSTASTDTAVTITVTCRLDTDQMGVLDVPARTVTATGRASIDPYFIQG